MLRVLRTTRRRLLPVLAAAAAAAVVAPAAVTAAPADAATTPQALTWGDNAAGALGDGTATTRLSPVPVPFVSGVTQVSTSTIDTLAIAGASGQVWAWGGNGLGELGDGTTTGHPVPEQIGVTGATQVDAGRDDSAAVRSDGTLLAWGDNSFGQLGFAASGTPQLTPRAVTGLTGVTQAMISNDEGAAIAQPPASHVVVPDVTGDAPAQAAAAIRSAGLTVGSTGFATSCDVPVGTIIRTIPAAGSLVAPGTTVGLIRSRGLSPDCA